MSTYRLYDERSVTAMVTIYSGDSESMRRPKLPSADLARARSSAVERTPRGNWLTDLF
jgi:hypothetical protein